MRRWLATAIITSLLLGVLASPAQSAGTFTNPLDDHGPDPWLQYYDGNYYLAATTWNNTITMRKSATLGGLASAPDTVVFTLTRPNGAGTMWAPEFHLLDGPDGKHWYLYCTAGEEPFRLQSQRIHVLESAGLDPMGPYTFKADMLDAASTVRQFQAETATAAAKSVPALNQISAAGTAGATEMSKAAQTFIQSLQRQVAAVQGGKTAALELRAAQLGVSEAAAPLLTTFRQLEAAQRDVSAISGNSCHFLPFR